MPIQFMKFDGVSKGSVIGETADLSRAAAAEAAVRTALSPSRGPATRIKVVGADATGFAEYAAKGITQPKIGSIFPTLRSAALAIGAHINTISTAFSAARAKAGPGKRVQVTVHGITFVLAD